MRERERGGSLLRELNAQDGSLVLAPNIIKTPVTTAELQGKDRWRRDHSVQIRALLDAESLYPVFGSRLASSCGPLSVNILILIRISRCFFTCFTRVGLLAHAVVECSFLSRMDDMFRCGRFAFNFNFSFRFACVEQSSGKVSVFLSF